MAALYSLSDNPVIGLLILLAFLIPLGLLVSRLFLSPLARLPGPWLTRISSMPEANALRDQRRTAWVNELFEQHPGAVAVRTAPRSVSFNTLEAVKAIYGE